MTREGGGRNGLRYFGSRTSGTPLFDHADREHGIGGIGWSVVDFDPRTNGVCSNRATCRGACVLYWGMVSGRLHHKSLSEEDLFEVGVVPTGGEAFVLHADLRRVIALQEAQRRAAEDAGVGVRVAKTQPGGTLRHSPRSDATR